MTTIPTIPLPPTLETLTFLAEEYDSTGDDIIAHQAAQALVTVWKAGNLALHCPSCEAHAATTPAELVKAAHALLGQAIVQMQDAPPSV